MLSQAALSTPTFHPSLQAQSYSDPSSQRDDVKNELKRNDDFVSALRAFSDSDEISSSNSEPPNRSARRTSKTDASEDGEPPVAVPVPFELPVANWTGLLGLASQNPPLQTEGTEANGNPPTRGGGATVATSVNNASAQPGSAAPEVDTPAAIAGPVAFGMVLRSPVENNENLSVSPEITETAANTGSVRSFLFKSASTATQAEAKPVSADQGTSDLARVFPQPGMTNSFEGRVETVETVQRVQGPVLEANPEVGSKEPVRHVQLQLSGENNQRVDVRVFDRGGELRVSVRAVDTNLAQTLRDHIPELTTRLEQQHFRSEVWIPRAAEAHAGNGRDLHSQDRGGSAQDHSGRRQRQPGDQPDWSEEERLWRRNTKETWNQIWQQ